jgi:Zn-dependent peptidase ImmA (M78 family)
MSDVEKKLYELHDISRQKRVRVLYDRLPDEDSFIAIFNNNSYIYLDVRLSEIKELVQLAHENGHVFCGISNETTPEWLDDIYEKRAWNWAATYLVPYNKYSEVMRDPFVDNDAEAAANLHVSIKILQKARKYYYSIGLPITKAELEYVYHKNVQAGIVAETPNVIKYDISESEPPTLYLPFRIDRTQKQKRYDIRRLKYKEYTRVMKQPNILCDTETAEELNIPIEFLRRARWFYKSIGLPVRQCELITDWRQWDY